MKPRGIVAASEYATNPWKKRDEPLEYYVDVFACYADGVIIRTCKVGGMWLDTDENPVIFWMHIPPLPREKAND